MENKKYVRGVATLAAIGAGALAVHLLTTRNKKGRAVRAAAEKTRDHVATRVAKIGKVTKKSYDHIVDAAVDELRAMKTLTDKEFGALAEEVKADWNGVKSLFQGETTQDAFIEDEV